MTLSLTISRTDSVRSFPNIAHHYWILSRLSAHTLHITICGSVLQQQQQRNMANNRATPIAHDSSSERVSNVGIWRTVRCVFTFNICTYASVFVCVLLESPRSWLFNLHITFFQLLSYFFL